MLVEMVLVYSQAYHTFKLQSTINQSINQSILIYKAINQSINQTIHTQAQQLIYSYKSQSFNQCIHTQVNHSTSKSNDQSTNDTWQVSTLVRTQNTDQLIRTNNININNNTKTMQCFSAISHLILSLHTNHSAQNLSISIKSLVVHTLEQLTSITLMNSDLTFIFHCFRDA